MTAVKPILPTLSDLSAGANVALWEFAARFWSKVEMPAGDDACWEWQRAKDENGYGLIIMPGKRFPDRAHRVSFAMAFGPISEGQLVCHTCDNPPCVRPSHFFLGGHPENIADMDRKGRRTVLYGEDQTNHKLTADQVRAIRRLIGEGVSDYTIGPQFGVSATAVYHIRTGRNWGWLI